MIINYFIYHTYQFEVIGSLSNRQFGFKYNVVFKIKFLTNLLTYNRNIFYSYINYFGSNLSLSLNPENFRSILSEETDCKSSEISILNLEIQVFI